MKRSVNTLVDTRYRYNGLDVDDAVFGVNTDAVIQALEEKKALTGHYKEGIPQEKLSFADIIAMKKESLAQVIIQSLLSSTGPLGESFPLTAVDSIQWKVERVLHFTNIPAQQSVRNVPTRITPFYVDSEEGRLVHRSQAFTVDAKALGMQGGYEHFKMMMRQFLSNFYLTLAEQLRKDVLTQKDFWFDPALRYDNTGLQNARIEDVVQRRREETLCITRYREGIIKCIDEAERVMMHRNNKNVPVVIFTTRETRKTLRFGNRDNLTQIMVGSTAVSNRRGDVEKIESRNRTYTVAASPATPGDEGNKYTADDPLIGTLVTGGYCKFRNNFLRRPDCVTNGWREWSLMHGLLGCVWFVGRPEEFPSHANLAAEGVYEKIAGELDFKELARLGKEVTKPNDAYYDFVSRTDYTTCPWKVDMFLRHIPKEIRRKDSDHFVPVYFMGEMDERHLSNERLLQLAKDVLEISKRKTASTLSDKLKSIFDYGQPIDLVKVGWEKPAAAPSSSGGPSSSGSGSASLSSPPSSAPAAAAAAAASGSGSSTSSAAAAAASGSGTPPSSATPPPPFGSGPSSGGNSASIFDVSLQDLFPGNNPGQTGSLGDGSNEGVEFSNQNVAPTLEEGIAFFEKGIQTFEQRIRTATADLKKSQETLKFLQSQLDSITADTESSGSPDIDFGEEGLASSQENILFEQLDTEKRFIGSIQRVIDEYTEKKREFEIQLEQLRQQLRQQQQQQQQSFPLGQQGNTGNFQQQSQQPIADFDDDSFFEAIDSGQTDGEKLKELQEEYRRNEIEASRLNEALSGYTRSLEEYQQIIEYLTKKIAEQEQEYQAVADTESESGNDALQTIQNSIKEARETLERNNASQIVAKEAQEKDSEALARLIVKQRRTKGKIDELTSKKTENVEAKYSGFRAAATFVKDVLFQYEKVAAALNAKANIRMTQMAILPQRIALMKSRLEFLNTIPNNDLSDVFLWLLSAPVNLYFFLALSAHGITRMPILGMLLEDSQTLQTESLVFFAKDTGQQMILNKGLETRVNYYQTQDVYKFEGEFYNGVAITKPEGIYVIPHVIGRHFVGGCGDRYINQDENGKFISRNTQQFATVVLPRVSDGEKQGRFSVMFVPQPAALMQSEQSPILFSCGYPTPQHFWRDMLINSDERLKLKLQQGPSYIGQSYLCRVYGLEKKNLPQQQPENISMVRYMNATRVNPVCNEMPTRYLSDYTGTTVECQSKHYWGSFGEGVQDQITTRIALNRGLTQDSAYIPKARVNTFPH